VTNLIYALLSFADSTVLIIWGILDLRKFHPHDPETFSYRRDGLFLVTIGMCGLGIYAMGHYRDRELNWEIASATLEQKKLEQRIEDERSKRVAMETTLQAFKTLTQLSDEALLGSRDSYVSLLALASEHSEISERAGERIKYIQRELAYYEQPPGIVLALELSATVSGKRVRIIELPTANLFKMLEDETITNTTRFSLINDICQKPIREVDECSREVLAKSKYLPAIAATTTILRRLHKQAGPFLDMTGWLTYLEHNSRP
jgi:hypothetical protein